MSDKKQKKPQKLKARLVRGFPDRSASDIRATDQMMAKIRTVYERFGFEPVETPFVEYTDALGKFLPDQDRPNEGVFSFQDDDDQWLSLRYDLTAPLARHVAENFNDIQLPYRSYRSGWVFRNEKPGPGRFRQFMQFDADIVGAPGVQADAEMCMMMADTMEALGIPRGDYVIRVNNRKVLDGVMEARGVTEAQKLTVLRSLDKFDKFGRSGVIELLTTGRKDDSGDFTAGAGLSSDSANKLARLFETPVLLSGLEENMRVGFGEEIVSFSQTWAEYLSSFKVDGKPIFDEADAKSSEAFWTLPIVLALADPIGDASAGTAGIGELLSIYNMITGAGYSEDRIKIDPSVVRGLEYYTGPVYEAELLFDVTNEKGQKVQFGSVGGGGRYDGLVSRFMGQPVPATGFSIGVSRLMTALKNLGKLSGDAASGPILITIMDRDRIGDYAKMAQELRTALNPLDDDGQPLGPTIPVELFQGNPKDFPKQLRYADRRGAPIAIIQGGNEKELGQIIVKDLIEGKRIAETITDNAEWREAKAGEHLVAEAELVSTVKSILEAQAAYAAKGQG
ncbi:histidyl-tRNA synthetase [Hoeflea sp. IMCC20628]|uniref:histidine--tRNA ligase n=1 Tax=Hoeflea sp. IMCC20628 TaxID=1620421 RepID=UPI00063AFD5F|nr:histidine--tRNA ligase [Hoeflea sp. IMCC20628]AKI01731.1 histidyl-tRNA synthetase [Hoeflea sp. IMCC20628]